MMSLLKTLLPASNCTPMETNVPVASLSHSWHGCVEYYGLRDLWSLQEGVIAVAINAYSLLQCMKIAPGN